jgi:hypothetical protein
MSDNDAPRVHMSSHGADCIRANVIIIGGDPDWETVQGSDEEEEQDVEEEPPIVPEQDDALFVASHHQCMRIE